MYPRAGARAGASGLQSEVGEDPLDHRRLDNGRNDLELAAAVRAVLEVDLEDTLEQPGPAQSRGRSVHAAGC